MIYLKQIKDNIERLNSIGVLLLNYKELLQPYHQEITQFLAHAKPYEVLIKEVVLSTTNSEANTLYKQYLQTNAFESFKDSLYKVNEILSTVINTNQAFNRPNPKVYIFPSGHSTSDWERNWRKHLHDDKVALKILQQQTKNLQNNLTYNISTITHFGFAGACTGMTSTLMSRLTEYIARTSQLPPLASRLLKRANHLWLSLLFMLSPGYSILVGGVSLISSAISSKLGLSPRVSRQLSTVAGITSVGAIELYNDPSPENIANTVSMALGSSISVYGTDYILDLFENTVKKNQSTSPSTAASSAETNQPKSRRTPLT